MGHNNVQQLSQLTLNLTTTTFWNIVVISAAFQKKRTFVFVLILKNRLHLSQLEVQTTRWVLSMGEQEKHLKFQSMTKIVDFVSTVEQQFDSTEEASSIPMSSNHLQTQRGIKFELTLLTSRGIPRRCWLIYPKPMLIFAVDALPAVMGKHYSKSK